MNQLQINNLATVNQKKAHEVLEESGIENILKESGCRVNLVGSLRMGLLASHRDIDLHVYSSGITTTSSFAIIAKIAKNPKVTEIRCINGLHTDERCIEWHLYYQASDDAIWQIDIIHIEEGTEYDGFFEKMADRIAEIITPEQKNTILRLKFETEEDKDYHGVEYYEAIISNGITTMSEFENWVTEHRKRPPYYWIP